MAGAEWVIIHGPVISSTNSSVLLLRSALLSLLQCYFCKHSWEIVVILWRWVGFKFSKLSPSFLRAKMKWLSLWSYFKRGKSLILFLNISRAFCYITRVAFLSCPTLICNSLWVMSQCLISGWDLRLWYTVQSLSFQELTGVWYCTGCPWRVLRVVSCSGGVCEKGQRLPQAGDCQLHWTLRRTQVSPSATCGHLCKNLF